MCVVTALCAAGSGRRPPDAAEKNLPSAVSEDSRPVFARCRAGSSLFARASAYA